MDLKSQAVAGRRSQVAGQSCVLLKTLNSQPSTLNLVRAFTLIELLVVISIIGVLAALTVPALKNLGKSNVAVSAGRQLLDDVGRARQLAITHRTTVYMAYVPTNFFNANFWTGLNNIVSPTNRATALTTASNLLSEQLSGYAFISNGQVGDQPGQHAYHYLDAWQALPQGTFIAAGKFFLPGGAAGAYYDIPQWETDNSGRLDNTWRTSQSGVYCFTNVLLPFPTEQSPQILMPAIAFDYLGRLISETPDGDSFHHAYIPLAQGTVGYGYDGKTKTPQPTAVQPSDIVENPPSNSVSISYNIVDIDPLTGRAKLQFFKIK